MKTTNKSKYAQAKNGLGMEGKLAKDVAGLNPATRLKLAACLERWARLLRFSVELQTPLTTTDQERLLDSPERAVPSIVSQRIEEQPTPPHSHAVILKPSLFSN